MNQAAQEQGSFWTRNIWIVILTFILIAGGVFTLVDGVSNARELSEQQAKVDALRSQYSTAEQTTASERDENVLEALGVTASRLPGDREIINDLVTTALTWDSGQSYDAARRALQKQFDLPEDGTFLTQFMPPATYNESSSGTRYYYLDAVGLNSEVAGDPSVEVIGVKGTKYTYSVTATTLMTVDANSEVSDEDGNQLKQPTQERNMLLQVTVDENGNVSDISGVPASGTIQHSGSKTDSPEDEEE